MEIYLQAFRSYHGLNGWTGAVDVGQLKMFQARRIAGARNHASLIRKFIKVLRGKEPPAELPPGLDPLDLDLRDVFQLMVGIAASDSAGRMQQRTFKCPTCGKLNPRSVDILKVFTPEKPEIEGGLGSVVFEPVTRDPKTPSGDPSGQPQVPPVSCRSVRVRDFLAVDDYVEELKQKSVSKDGKDGKVNLKPAQDKFGEMVTDEDDLVDLLEDIEQVGLIAQVTTIPGCTGFEQTLLKLLNLKGAEMKLYSSLSETVVKLSPKLDGVYETACTAVRDGKPCEAKITGALSPADYFFDFR